MRALRQVQQTQSRYGLENDKGVQEAMTKPHKLKHQNKKDKQPLSGVIDTVYRNVVNNSGSKTIALAAWLQHWEMVRIDLIEKTDKSITIKISEAV